VPVLAAEAKKGKPFPIETNAQGVVQPLWLKSYAPKLHDLRKSKLVALGNTLVPGSFKPSSLTWPHEKS